MRRIAFAATLLFASAAQAQTLYKCVSGDAVSYQQAACPKSARTVRTIETTPEPPPTAAELAERDLKSRRDRAESEFLSHLAGTDRLASAPARSAHRPALRRSEDLRQGDACRIAKTTRERTLRRVGLARTLDLLRKLDAEVAEACGHG